MLKRIKNLLKRNKLLIAVFITLLIGFLSLVELKTKSNSNSFQNIDKLEHAIAYWVLSLSWFFAMQKIKNTELFIVLSCVAYGILLEVLQIKFTIYRLGEIADGIANAVGTLLGLLTFKLLFKKNM